MYLVLFISSFKPFKSQKIQPATQMMKDFQFLSAASFKDAFHHPKKTWNNHNRPRKPKLLALLQAAKFVCHEFLLLMWKSNCSQLFQKQKTSNMLKATSVFSDFIIAFCCCDTKITKIARPFPPAFMRFAFSYKTLWKKIPLGRKILSFLIYKKTDCETDDCIVSSNFHLKTLPPADLAPPQRHGCWEARGSLK